MTPAEQACVAPEAAPADPPPGAASPPATQPPAADAPPSAHPPEACAPLAATGRPAARDTETEIKLLASPAMLAALAHHPLLAGDERCHTLVSTCFDTISGRLSLAGATLRLRDKNGQREQTLKLAQRERRQLARAEWNVAPTSPADQPDLEAFPPRARHALARLCKGGALHGFARITVERRTRVLRHGEALIELAFDRGEIRALPLPDGENPGRPGAHAPICELELELLAGEPGDLMALARALPLGQGLTWALAGKSERAHALAYDRPRRAAHGSAPCLPANTGAGAALKAIGWSCLIPGLANIALIIDTDEEAEEAVHQARVALRRLRAAIGVFGPLYAFDPEARSQAALLRRRLGGLARVMAPLREAHVLARRLGAAQPPALDALIATELAALRQQLAGLEAQDTLMAAAQWLEAGLWRTSPLADRPALGMVGAAMSRWRKRLRKARRQIDTLDDAALHELRIQVKKLRYAASFAAPMLPAGERRQAEIHERILAAMQDVLGDWHDAQGPALSPLLPADLAAQAQTIAPADSRHHMLAKLRSWLGREKRVPAWWQGN